jgi:phosphatidylglycerophosphate synthase
MTKSISQENFAGATKAGASLLSPLERRLAPHLLPLVPLWLGTHHLTLLTLAWSALTLGCGYLARGDRRWLWGSSLAIVLQYLTDHLDGKVGKTRGTGLVRWGFYMDHLLDYVFLCAVLIGYAFILPERTHLGLLLVLAVFAGLMVNSFLMVAALGRFHISHFGFGPTEFRLALLIVNTLVFFYGARLMGKALPYVAAGGLVALCVLVYRTQREVWRRDMEERRRQEFTAVAVLGQREAA